MGSKLINDKTGLGRSLLIMKLSAKVSKVLKGLEGYAIGAHIIQEGEVKDGEAHHNLGPTLLEFEDV